MDLKEIIQPIIECEFLRDDRECGHTPITRHTDKKSWDCYIFTCPRLHRFIREMLKDAYEAIRS